MIFELVMNNPGFSCYNIIQLLRIEERTFDKTAPITPFPTIFALFSTFTPSGFKVSQCEITFYRG